MSTNYMHLVAWGGTTHTTPADEAHILTIPGCPNPMMAISLQAVVLTAATTAATPILETFEASPTVLATVTIGTSAARTIVGPVLVTEANRQIAASISLRVRESTGGDGTAVYAITAVTTYNWV